MWQVSEDRETALIQVEIDSAPDDLELTKTKLSLKRQMAVMRNVAGRARILFDLTDYPGTPTEVVDRFQHVDGEFVQDDRDWFALVVPRSLDKVETRAILRSPQAQVFVSSDAARTWLLSR